MSYELRPCLRCGNVDEDNNIVSDAEWDDERCTRYWIICECGLSICGHNEMDAVRLWNERPVEDALRAQCDSVPWGAIRCLEQWAWDTDLSYPDCLMDVMDWRCAHERASEETA